MKEYSIAWIKNSEYVNTRCIKQVVCCISWELALSIIKEWMDDPDWDKYRDSIEITEE